MGKLWRSHFGSYQLVPPDIDRQVVPRIYYQCDRLGVVFTTEGWVACSGDPDTIQRWLFKAPFPGYHAWCPERAWTEEELAALNDSMSNKTSTKLHRLLVRSRDV